MSCYAWANTLYSPTVAEIKQFQKDAIEIVTGTVNETDEQIAARYEESEYAEEYIKEDIELRDYYINNDVLKKISSEALSDEVLSLIYEIIEPSLNYTLYEGRLYDDIPDIDPCIKIYNDYPEEVFIDADSFIEWIRSKGDETVFSYHSELAFGLTPELEKWIRNFFSVEGRCISFG